AHFADGATSAVAPNAAAAKGFAIDGRGRARARLRSCRPIRRPRTGCVRCRNSRAPVAESDAHPAPVGALSAHNLIRFGWRRRHDLRFWSFHPRRTATRLPSARKPPWYDRRVHRRVVMVVEDDPEIRRTLVRYLERAGLEIVAVEDGQIAIDRLTDGLRPTSS